MIIIKGKLKQENALLQIGITVPTNVGNYMYIKSVTNNREDNITSISNYYVGSYHDESLTTC